MTKKPASTTASKKPARSSTKAASTKPRATRTVTKAAAKAPQSTVVKTTPKTGAVASGSSERPAPEAAAGSPSASTEVTKKVLLDRLMAETGMGQGDARRALEATLGVLGAVLHEGHDIAAAPLGMIKITRTKETANGKLAICRIKLKSPVVNTTAPLADPAD